MTSRKQFAPLCDLHHTAMDRKMIEEDGEEIRSFHACRRPDCTRVFRDALGYLDRIEGEFDESRASLQRCPLCDSVLFLAEVDHARKLETWDCPQSACPFSAENASPSAR
ncbi:hypothetical protein DYQ86_26130 [Acidobacteria bacterium AB60]|nr:hypothetical protein DYQ86_26130 [Acidobacteria bacterium AB60]